MAIQFLGLPAVRIDPAAQRLDFSGLNQALGTYRRGAADEARTDHLRKAAALNDPRAQADYLFRAGLPAEAAALGTYPLQRDAMAARLDHTEATTNLLRAQTAAARQAAELRRNLLAGGLADGSGTPPPSPAMPATPSGSPAPLSVSSAPPAGLLAAPGVTAPGAPGSFTPNYGGPELLPPLPQRAPQETLPTLGREGGIPMGAPMPAAAPRPAASVTPMPAMPMAAPAAAAAPTVIAPNGRRLGLDQARQLAMQLDIAGLRVEPFERAIAAAEQQARGGNVPEAVRTQALKVDTAFRSIASGLDDYVRLVERTGVNFLPGQDNDAIQQTRTGLLLQLKELFNLGVLNGPDLTLMERMLTDPSVGIGLTGPYGLPNVIPGNAAARVRSGAENLRRMLTQIRNQAVAPIGGAPMQAPQADAGGWQQIGGARVREVR